MKKLVVILAMVFAVGCSTVPKVKEDKPETAFERLTRLNGRPIIEQALNNRATLYGWARVTGDTGRLIFVIADKSGKINCQAKKSFSARELQDKRNQNKLAMDMVTDLMECFLEKGLD